MPNDTAIANAVGVSRSTITNWKRDAEFQAMVQDAQSKIKADALRLPIAQKTDRVRRLNDLYEKYFEIIERRAERYAKVADTPADHLKRVFGSFTPEEATTGLLVEQQKISAGGITVTDWVFDKALDSAIKEAQKQAAQELGQWEETVNLNHNPYRNDALAPLSDDALESIEAILERESDA